MDQSAYLSLLERTEEETIDAARRAGTAPAATEGQWSPLELLEHIVLTEGFVASILQRPSTLLHEAETVHGSGKLHHLIVNKRAFKREAPPQLCPTGRFATTGDFEHAFRTQRAALRADLRSGALRCDNRMYPHPALGNMTVEDWLYFIVHHTERHVAQLNERFSTPV